MKGLMKKLKSILSNNRCCLKQAFQEQALPEVNQQSVSKIHLVSQQQPQNLFFLILSPSQTKLAIFETKSVREFFTIKFAHTKETLLLALLLCSHINVGVFLFHKNHVKNPPEPTKNLAVQTEKSIKTHCKPCKNRLLHKKTLKNKDHERDFAKLRCLAGFSFFL